MPIRSKTYTKTSTAAHIPSAANNDPETVEIEFPKSKVYVLADEQGRITRVEGGYTISNIQNIEEWTFIDEGYGDKYNLCQSNYFEKPIRTEEGVYRYKLADGKAVERTEEEIEADRAAIPVPVVPPTNEELEQENKLLRAQIQAAVDRQDFIEDCIAEMAMQVYAE